MTTTPRLGLHRLFLSALACAAAATGCASGGPPPLPAGFEPARASIAVAASAPVIRIAGLSGGKAHGAGVGAATGGGAGVGIAVLACLPTLYLYGLCLASVLPTATWVGAAAGGAIGAHRSEGIDALQRKTTMLRDALAATSYSSLLAAEVGGRLQATPLSPASPPGGDTTGVADAASAAAWPVEVGIDDIGTDGKAEYAVWLVARLSLREPGVSTPWQRWVDVTSDHRLGTDEWSAGDAAVLRAVLARCVQTAAALLAREATPAPPGSAKPHGLASTSCGDAAVAAPSYVDIAAQAASTPAAPSRQQP